jgi:SNF2 family DNA or RNA helicase
MVTLPDHERGEPDKTVSLSPAELVGKVRCDEVPLGFELPAVFGVELAAEPEWVLSCPLAPFEIKTLGCRFDARPARALAAVGRDQETQNCGVDSESELRNTEQVPPGHETLGRAACFRPRTPGSRRTTRIRPPRDVVKLEDRLRLLLQPPLESLLTAQSLRFAHPPFGYQLDGIAFLYPRDEAVLADEMGLGKTMQAITAVRLLAHHGYVRRVLLICPKPLVSNWRREFALWAPELPLTVVEGGPARRQFLWRESRDVVTIANYEAIVRDRTDVCDPDTSFDLVLLDEAQRIKNSASTTSEVVRSITRARSWALTGTPMENSVDDLAGIFEFVAPGCLDANMKPRAIAQAVSDHVLRRTKDQVLTDLPPKLFRDAELELTPEQAEAYRLAEDEGVVRLREMKRAVTIQHVFELILRLKQICNFDPATGASSKLERLEADLEECAASGRKAIVFSQWVQSLSELKSRLKRFGPTEYHGQVPHRRREAAIEQFRDDPECCVMLMTYGAGSVGLNLQFASYVFLFDRWWNPAVEDQAINRAHRIGIARPVTVTRFLAVNTIEQRINEILDRKRELFDTVFGQGISAPTSGLSREEFFSLFDLEPPSVLPADAA